MLNSLVRAYYRVRPFVPRRLQVFLRGKVVRGRYRFHKHRWPIPEKENRCGSSGGGWPAGRRFAFVLTHDVETGVGQDRCLELMSMEKDLGFLSSFNFVPERYAVSEFVRDRIAANGCEVGVHDLNHDGRLYASRTVFLDRAEKINAYLKNWGAVGFRSAAMHRNLEWIHRLNIEYDASTFDVDPFEPQSDGIESIFPVWVQRNGGLEGYVELPYTLPQDFTLFVLLKNQDIALWRKKLDWVAARGGMALVITHPDYMCFDGGKPRFEEYPVERYRDLLEYVSARYAGQYWNALPRDVARYFRKVCIN